jgi:hypothetical protein
MMLLKLPTTAVAQPAIFFSTVEASTSFCGSFRYSSSALRRSVFALPSELVSVVKLVSECSRLSTSVRIDQSGGSVMV